MVHQALGGNGRTDPCVDDPRDLEHALATVDHSFDAVPDVKRRRRLRGGTVDADVTASAGVGRR